MKTTNKSIIKRTLIIVEGGVIQAIITEGDKDNVFIVIDHDQDERGTKQFTEPPQFTTSEAISSILSDPKNN